MGLATAASCAPAWALELLRGNAAGCFGLYDDYYFYFKDAMAHVIIWGRDGSPTRQAVYVEYSGYFMEDNKSHIAEIAEGNYFSLEDTRGNVFDPKAVIERGRSGFHESAAAVFELQFEGEFEGELRLRVKMNEGQTGRLYFGPAARDFFRRATVTELGGLNLRTGPSLEAEVKAVLQAGGTFYVTAFRSIYWPEDSESLDDAIMFREVTREGDTGWVASGYFEIGGFEAF